MTLRRTRQNRIARVAVGACVLLAAFAVQYYLANLPLALDLEASGKFSPAAARRAEQELVVEEPAVGSPEGYLFLNDGREREVVDVYFNDARLDQETIADLSWPGFNPPATPSKIDYVAADEAQKPAPGQPCETQLRIRVKDGKPPRALHLYQLGAAGADRYRQIEMKIVGGELLVEMVNDTPPASEDEPETEDEPEGCQRTLRVGGLPGQSVPLSTEVAVVVTPGSAFRFRFRPRDPQTPLWDGGTEGFFAPFELPPQVTPNDPPPLQARGVSVRRLRSADPATPPVLNARSADGGPLLNVSGPEVGSDELRIKVTGRGLMSVNGQPVTVDFLERVTKQPIPAAILAGVNAALLAWFVSLVRPKKSSPRAAK